MIRTYNEKTANDVWMEISRQFTEAADSKVQPSRVCSTREMLHVGISIQNPLQRWIVGRRPALNPAFAIAEVVWILMGRNDSAFLTYWNRQLPNYAGDGATFYGAYGERLRSRFKVDQLHAAFDTLRSNPASRQVVLEIWDPTTDLPSPDGEARSEDIPCNIVSLLKVRDGRLEWMQIMRSNDLFLGLPHNIVQFTTLQEVVAGWLDIGVGSYNHISDSLHVYERDIEKLQPYSSVSMARNSDSLAAPYEESMKFWTQLSSATDRLVAGSLTISDHKHILTEAEYPTSYHNFLRVLVAESLRRTEGLDEAEEVMTECINPALQQVWRLWVQRVSAGQRS
jgi:thymidylate synthase